MQRFGDKNLLDTLNAVVTGTHALSMDYKAIEDGDDKRRFVMKIVTAYRKAAKAKLAIELPEGSNREG